MAIKSNFNEAKISNDVDKQVDSLYEKIIYAFNRAGLNFVTQARQQIQNHDLGTYNDQTTNLRNSIGYYIFHNGEMVIENVIGNAVANRALINDLVLPDGFQLILIAGMNYASFVESKGYNVITLQKDQFVVNLTNYLTKLEVIENEDYNEKVQEMFN